MFIRTLSYRLFYSINMRKIITQILRYIFLIVMTYWVFTQSPSLLDAIIAYSLTYIIYVIWTLKQHLEKRVNHY